MKRKKASRRKNSGKLPIEKESSSRVREEPANGSSQYRNIITIEPGKRGGKPCIRGMRITVGDILRWLASGMSEAEILCDYPELTQQDIRASLAYAAERSQQSSDANQNWRDGESQLSTLAKRWAGKFTLPKSDPNDPRLDYLLKKYWRHRE